MKFAFVEQHRAEFDIMVMCHVLGVSRSGYYAWRKRQPSKWACENRDLSEKIQQFHQRSRQTYGSPRIWADLQHLGIRCSRKRVARLMRRLGLRSKSRGHYKVRRRGRRPAYIAENVLARDFSAAHPDQKWVADISYVSTQEGWLYLAVVLDLYSRKVVGWSMASHMKAELVSDALQMAIARRLPGEDLLHHSDRGSQYTSERYITLLKRHQIKLSMSRAGSPHDNAAMESFYATLKTECIDRRYPTRSEARQAIFEFIEVWYNRLRRHSSLGYLSPEQYELSRRVT
ncbi:MAG: IS3 family transposase [Chloroflexi bacterium]|nr:IS3 family transposase [Chloroflexota bacterium]